MMWTLPPAKCSFRLRVRYSTVECGCYSRKSRTMCGASSINPESQTLLAAMRISRTWQRSQGPSGVRQHEKLLRVPVHGAVGW